MAIRSVRDNNPGNIRIGIAWQGLTPPAELTGEQASEKAFCVFESPAYGFRAMAVILLGYQRRHHLHTIQEYISTWAPPNENDTEAYVNAVANECGARADDVFDLVVPQNLRALTRAIARHEAGGWYFEDSDLDRGIAMAEGVGAQV